MVAVDERQEALPAWGTSLIALTAVYDETVAYVHDFIVKNGPFDGIMGFSQGACMAAIVAALVSVVGVTPNPTQLEKPGLNPNFPAEPPLPRMKCGCELHSCSLQSSSPSAASSPSPRTQTLQTTFPCLQRSPCCTLSDGLTSSSPRSAASRSLTSATTRASSTTPAATLRRARPAGGISSSERERETTDSSAYITAVSAGEDQHSVPPVNSFGPSGANTPATGNATPRPSTPVDAPKPAL